MIESQVEFFFLKTQNTDEPSKPRKKYVNEMLVLGPLRILHIYFLQIPSFLPIHNKRGRVVGVSEYVLLVYFFAFPFLFTDSLKSTVVVPGLRGYSH